MKTVLIIIAVLLLITFVTLVVKAEDKHNEDNARYYGDWYGDWYNDSKEG